MNDQASALRQIVQNIKKQRIRDADQGARVVCVTSGKGGVGKTNFTVNLAISLSKKGLRVLIIDADFGLANVDVILGITPEYDLSHVIHRQKSIKEVIMEGPNGIMFISGGSGVLDLLQMSDTQIQNLTGELLTLDDAADVIIFDTGAGVSQNIMRIVESSNEVLVVTTPEPTAIMDAYALIKTVVNNNCAAKLRLIVNRAESVADAEDTLAKFSGVVRLYLKADIEALGYVLTDPVVARAVRLQRPFILSFPKSTASRNIDSITWKFMNIEPDPKEGGGLKGFLHSIMNKQKQ